MKEQFLKKWSNWWILNGRKKELNAAFEKELNELIEHEVSLRQGRLYAFLYNDCIHESSSETMSLHFSKEGAEKAMEEHKQKALDKFNKRYSKNNEFGFKFGAHQSWCVEPVSVLP